MYEKRYELSKLALESGVDMTDFEKMTSKEKFLVLSHRLKKTNRVHLASFFFGKLFEISGNLEALANKIDCLIELGEYEEAFRFNCIGFELYLEDPDSEPEKYERIFQYQKGVIAFSTEKYHIAEWIAEESIIKFKDNKFYYLLCAVFIAVKDYNSAAKTFKKYGGKICSVDQFLSEVFVLLLSVDLLANGVYFIDSNYFLDQNKKNELFRFIDNYFISEKTKIELQQYLSKNILSLQKKD